MSRFCASWSTAPLAMSMSTCLIASQYQKPLQSIHHPACAHPSTRTNLTGCTLRLQGQPDSLLKRVLGTSWVQSAPPRNAGNMHASSTVELFQVCACQDMVYRILRAGVLVCPWYSCIVNLNLVFCTMVSMLSQPHSYEL